MKSGVAQGVVVGSQYVVHRDHIVDAVSNPPLFRARVASTTALTSILVAHDAGSVEISEPAYACLDVVGPGQELCVYLAPELELALKDSKIWAEKLCSNETSPGFRFTVESEAHLCLDIGPGGKISFGLQHAEVNFWGLSILPHEVPVDAEALVPVLESAGMWNWHLKRFNRANPLKGSVVMEFYQLQETVEMVNSDSLPTLTPGGGNMIQNAAVHVLVNTESVFGVKLVNKSPHDLYPFLFYFDTCAQEISEPIYKLLVGE
jgi:hypothetical protein